MQISQLYYEMEETKKNKNRKKKKKREIQRAPAQIFHLYNGCYRDLIENIKL